VKKYMWIAALFVASSASAQPRQWVVGGNMGANETGSPGASFFFQSEKKEDGVITLNQVIAFGAHVKVSLYESKNWIVDMRPGAHISIIDDVATTTGRDDKTTFGPSFRAAIAYRITQQFEAGIERMELWNWFDGDAPSNSAYTSLVARFRF
jgi:hypothetical protein